MGDVQIVLSEKLLFTKTEVNNECSGNELFLSAVVEIVQIALA